MINNEWFIIQDGECLTEETYTLFQDEFEFGDINKTKRGYYSRFVGFIFCGDKVLISFPKHYFSLKEILEYQPVNPTLKHDLYSEIKTLFRVIEKTIVRKSEKTFGAREDLNSAYPLHYFYEIYTYYLKNGLYVNEQEIKKQGYSGKIDWKNTILKSPIVISNGQLLYMPLTVKNKITEFVFISKCMAYTIDSTVDKMGFIMDFKRTGLDTKDINWSNKGKIISQLYHIKQFIFKDKQKKLIDNLINFFRNETIGSHTFKLKTWRFDLIWEEMIGVYLNHYFSGINENGYITFSQTKLLREDSFQKGKFFPDVLKESGRRLEPDFYLVKDGVRYIFDGKYYSEVKELNYKQIAYYFLLKHHEGIHVIQSDTIVPLLTHNILILPTNMHPEDPSNFKVHFNLDTNYNRDESELKIKEQYCNTKQVMFSYIN